MHIPRKYGDFVFGVIQAGLTSAIAAGVASTSFFGTFAFVENWFASWLFAWMTTIPIVLLAAPGIRRVVLAITIESGDRRPTGLLRWQQWESASRECTDDRRSEEALRGLRDTMTAAPAAQPSAETPSALKQPK
jgi:hypothetical protein